jgi:hypothetical protein
MIHALGKEVTGMSDAQFQKTKARMEKRQFSTAITTLRDAQGQDIGDRVCFMKSNRHGRSLEYAFDEKANFGVQNVDIDKATLKAISDYTKRLFFPENEIEIEEIEDDDIELEEVEGSTVRQVDGRGQNPHLSRPEAGGQRRQEQHPQHDGLNRVNRQEPVKTTPGPTEVQRNNSHQKGKEPALERNPKRKHQKSVQNARRFGMYNPFRLGPNQTLYIPKQTPK